MGNSNSRIDKFYGNYEKSFERLQADVERLKARAAARAQRNAHLSRWTGAAVFLTIAVSVGVVYQVQSQPHGTYSYQQHFSRIGTAVTLPVAACIMHWALLLVLGWVEGRDVRKLKALEAAKRSMIKELKDMSRFDKIKSLIDKFDPDVRRSQPIETASASPMRAGQQRPGSGRQQQQQSNQLHHGGQVPGMLMKGSGQVAGAAALAVAGAGKAIMPLLDKVATSLISDNPMLLEDLRRAQAQLHDAEMRMMNAVHESFAVKGENLDIKQRLVELEMQLGLPPSYDVEALQEQLQQQQLVQQQLPWVSQQCIQAGGVAQQQTGDATVTGDGGGGGGVNALTCPVPWSGEPDGSAAGDANPQQQQQQQQPTATNAPQTPISAARDVAVPESGAAVGRDWGAEGMGEGLQGVKHDDIALTEGLGMRQGV